MIVDSFDQIEPKSTHDHGRRPECLDVRFRWGMFAGEREGEGGAMAGRTSTRITVLIAGAANVLVGVIKLVAGIMVGSSAMLAEAAHSAADTLNQGFLLASVHRGEEIGRASCRGRGEIS